MFYKKLQKELDLLRSDDFKTQEKSALWTLPGLGDTWSRDDVIDATESLLDAVDEDATESDFDEAINEVADGLIDIYYADRTAWLAEDLRRSYFCDDALREFGAPESTFDLIAQGQFMFYTQMLSEIVNSIR